jgi:quercetin dioxygenase-like cupin family protein
MVATSNLEAAMRALIAILLIAASTAASADASGSKPIVTTQILSTKVTAAGQPILLPAGAVRVIATRYEIAPGATLPVHKHPYPRYAYVLSGHLTVTDADSGARNTYQAGDVIVEMIDRWHSGQNTGTDPVRLLVIDQIPDGAAATILRDK